MTDRRRFDSLKRDSHKRDCAIYEWHASLNKQIVEHTISIEDWIDAMGDALERCTCKKPELAGCDNPGCCG